MGDLFLLLLLAILCQGGAGQTNTPTDPTTITSTVPTTTDLSTTGPPGDDDLPQNGEDCSNVPNLPERWRSSDGLCCRCCAGITRCRRRRECETELEVTPNCVNREFFNGKWWICVERRCVLRRIFGNRRRRFGSRRRGLGGRRPFNARGPFCVEDNSGGGGGGEATTPRTGEAPPLPDRRIRGDEDDGIDDGLLEEDEETDSGWPGRRRSWRGRRRGGRGGRRGRRGGRRNTPSIRWF